MNRKNEKTATVKTFVQLDSGALLPRRQFVIPLDTNPARAKLQEQAEADALERQEQKILQRLKQLKKT